MTTDRDSKRAEDAIDETLMESFPASDPPSWSHTHAGPPAPPNEPIARPVCGPARARRRRVPPALAVCALAAALLVVAFSLRRRA